MISRADHRSIEPALQVLAAKYQFNKSTHSRHQIGRSTTTEVPSLRRQAAHCRLWPI